MHKGGGGLKSRQEALSTHVAELQADLAGRDIQQAVRCSSSLGYIKTVEEYQRDREHSIHSLLKVPSVKDTEVQYEVLQEQCELCMLPEVTSDNLPHILHQFYCDKLSQLVQLKHMHLVRWARFALGHPKVTEELNHQYQSRLELVMQEYSAALNHARRLSVARDHLLGSKPLPSGLISLNDVLPYLKWRVFHQQAIKSVSAFLASVQWLPMLFHREFSEACRLSDAQGPAQKALSPLQSEWLSSTQQPPVSSSTQQPATHTGNSNKLWSLEDQVTSGRLTVPLPLSLGGAAAVDQARVLSLGLPFHSTDIQEFRDVLQELMFIYTISGKADVKTSSEHLQLYYHVNRKFSTTFQSQETASVFHTYDHPTDGEAIPKSAKSQLKFRKPSNWVLFNKIRAEVDTTRLEVVVKMKEQVQEVDTLLHLGSQCTHLHNMQRALNALRQHCIAVRHPSPATPLSVSSHKTAHDTMTLWKCIYSGLDARNPLSSDAVDKQDSEGALVEDEKASEEGEDPSYQPDIEIPEAMKLIQNQEGRKVSAQAHSVPKDAYFAFLLLRHLRIRDERMKCLEMLNYMRSLERTLVINSEGFSLEASHSHSGLLSHSHLHSTPADHIINEMEFIQYMEVENHDDYYVFDSSRPVHVWDQKGVPIVYEAAIADLESLEQELLLTGSFYIQRHREGGRKKGDVDISLYSNQFVDRFAVLYDLWTAEVHYNEAKIKVINCYMEAYHHVYDRNEKAKLAKVVLGLAAARPRHNLQAPYFTGTYQMETQCLLSHYKLIQALTSYQLAREREAIDILAEDSEDVFGLPPPPVHKHPVSLSGDKHVLIQSHLLEFCNSLCVVSSLPAAIGWALNELVDVHGAETSSEVVALHHKLLELLLIEWEEFGDVGRGYTSDVQTNLFTGVYVEDPFAMSRLCGQLSREAGARAEEEHLPPQEHQLQCWAGVLQLISLRHHLLLTCAECQVLVTVYKTQLEQLDQEPCHAHLRCVPFDYNLRLPASKSLQFFVEQAKEAKSSSRLDRYTPARLQLAIHELDEKYVAKFSFRSRDGICRILSGHCGMECLRVTLQAQVCHRSALMIACQQNSSILRYCSNLQSPREETQLHDDIRSHMSTSSTAAAHQHSSFPPSTSATVTASQAAYSMSTARRLRKCFVSIQNEKTPVRDFMLAEFTAQPASVLKSQEELGTTKCMLVSRYCRNLLKMMAHHSLRAQLDCYYSSILKLLEDFPATREAHFTVGQMKEEDESDYHSKVLGSFKDARQHWSRPHLVLSRDGKKLLNLWYIPHLTEILSLFNNLEMDDCINALTMAVHLVSSLHNILSYLCAYTRLSSSQSQAVSGSQTIGGGWGGNEGIGAEIQQLQLEMSFLDDPCDPEQVYQYLRAFHELLYLRHSIIIQHYLRRTLLLKGKAKAIEVLDNTCCVVLSKLSDKAVPHLSYPMLSSLPAPLDTLLSQAQSLIPWTLFLSSHGPYPGSFQQHYTRGELVYTSLASLDPIEKSLANGEMLGMSLLLQDIIQCYEHLLPRASHSSMRMHFSPRPTSTSSRTTPTQHQLSHLQLPQALGGGAGSTGTTPVRMHSGRRRYSIRRQSGQLAVQGAGAIPPVEGLKLLIKFLTCTSQLEVLKNEWGLKILGVWGICTQKQCKLLEDAYRDKVFSIAKTVVAKKQATEMVKLQMENETLESSETFMTEASVGESTSSEQTEAQNEMVLRETQVKCLVELVDQLMVKETCKHLSKLHHLLLSEKERDETTLPLDLWKRDTMKEIVGLPRSHVVEEFVDKVGEKMKEKGEYIVEIPKSHLKECLYALSSGVLAREKECYQMYASYYEAILRGQYNQLYQQSRIIDHFRKLAESNMTQSERETLVFVSDHTHSLILEITALRSRISELEDTLVTQSQEVRQRVLQEYGALVEGMFSASMEIKGRFEDYRKKLYGDMIQSLYEVREATAENTSKLKEKLGMSTGVTKSGFSKTIESLRAEGMKDIQQENTELISALIKIKALNGWNRAKVQASHQQELDATKEQLTCSQNSFLELRMQSEEEIASLQQQVNALQKMMLRMERECEVLKRKLEEEKQKNVSITQSTSKSQDGSSCKAKKLPGVKVDILISELEERNRQLKSLTVDKTKLKKQSEIERTRRTKEMQKMKHMLHHERQLKSEAYSQVDELIAQVHKYEVQNTSLLASIHKTPTTPDPSIPP